MSRRPVTAVAIPGAVVIVAVLSLCAPRGEPASAPSPSAASASPTLAAASPTATASPSPTPQGLYLSKKLGYALDLGPTWHPAICGSSDPGKASLPATEQFTSAGPLEEYIGHVGSANDRVEVTVQDNPQRLSPMAFAARPEAVVTGTPRSVTFVGRPAAEVDSSGMGGERFAVYVADGDRMYAVLYRAERPASAPRPDLATMMRIIRSFRFVSAADLQALPDPTPIPAPAPTTQALAVLLATAFQQKDPAALERLLAPCVNYGVQNGGGGLLTRQLFIAGLRTQFSKGLTATVDANAMRAGPYAGETVTYVRSRWNGMPPADLRPPPSPGQPQNVDLMMYPTREGFYWLGVLLVGP